MRLLRSVCLIASALFLMVHQLVPHQHEHHTSAAHFCTPEQVETWSRLVGGLSLDLGQHHLELFYTPKAVQFATPKNGIKAGIDKPICFCFDAVAEAGRLPLLLLFYSPNNRLRRAEFNISPCNPSAFVGAGRAPPFA